MPRILYHCSHCSFLRDDQAIVERHEAQHHLADQARVAACKNFTSNIANPEQVTICWPAEDGERCFEYRIVGTDLARSTGKPPIMSGLA